MKFNVEKQPIEKRVASHPDATVNHEGGLHFKVSAKMDLYLRACASFLEGGFYQSADSNLKGLQKAIADVGDREFILKLAAYARNEMNLRSIPVALLAEASMMHMNGSPNEGKSDVRHWAPRILRRADEPAEVLAYLKNIKGLKGKKTLPHALLKGIGDAMKHFDEYQLAKYDKSGKDFSMSDVFKLVWTSLKPEGDEHRELWKRAIEGELSTPETWEVKVTAAAEEAWRKLGLEEYRASHTKDEVESWKNANGRKNVIDLAKAEAWNEISEKMGIMALLRNIRNFEQTGAKEALERVIAALGNEEWILKSKQLPFRWMSAAEHAGQSDMRIQDGLRDAIETSVKCVPKWDGQTRIFGDNSGSMSSPVSKHSKVRMIDIAGLLGAIALHSCDGNARLGVFGHTFKWVTMSRRDSILTNAKKAVQTDVGHSTNAWLCIQQLRKEKDFCDRVLLFSDMQCYNTGTGGYWGYGEGNQSLASEWTKYRAEVNPKARLYSVNLQAYGGSQFPEDDKSVVLLSGWSEKVFNLIPAIEGASNAVQVIEDME